VRLRTRWRRRRGERTLTWEQILETLRETTYKPDWAIKITTRRRAVTVAYEYPATHSDPSYTGTPVRVSGKFALHLGPRCTELELARLLLNGFIDAEMHETREFLRLGDRVPFHPHTGEGQDAMSRTWYLAVHPRGDT
jgi:hypothetical protein